MPKTNDAIASQDSSSARFSRIAGLREVRLDAMPGVTLESITAGDVATLRPLVPRGIPATRPRLVPRGPQPASRDRDDAAHGRFARLLEVDAWSRVRSVVDLVMLVLATGLAVITTQRLENRLVDVLAAFSFPLLVMVAMHRRRHAERTLSASFGDSTGNAVTAVLISGIVALALSTLAGVHHSVQISLRLGAFAAGCLVVGRSALFAIRTVALRRDALRCPTVVVGSGELGHQLTRRLDESTHYGLRPVALLLPGTTDLTAIRSAAGPEALAAVLDETEARHVLLALDAAADDVTTSAIAECHRRGIAVSLVPHLYEHFPSAATRDHIGGVPVVTVRRLNPASAGFTIKHAIDRAFAAVLLLIMAPTLLAIAVGVRMSSPGPMLFRQRRVGRDGAEFDLLKFRTMRVAAEIDGDVDGFVPVAGAAPGGVEGVDRRTGIGRLLRATSLDELPQLFNVLRGDMSLVGPRPERPEYVARFSEEIDGYAERHRVKSGITGLAQANGLRGKTSMHDRVELDNFYIRNWSLGLDLRICFMTVREVFRMRAE